MDRALKDPIVILSTTCAILCGHVGMLGWQCLKESPKRMQQMGFVQKGAIQKKLYELFPIETSSLTNPIPISTY